MADATKPIIAVTMGDPAGIGPEVVVEAYPDLIRLANVVVVGDASVLRRAAEIVGTTLDVRAIDDVASAQFNADTVDVLDIDNVEDLEHGVVRETYGAASLEYIERAIGLANGGMVDGITTAPINKQATKLAGSEFAGHTGILADRTNTERFTMMLIEDELRVTHVSTHVPLREACEHVSTEAVYETIVVTEGALLESAHRLTDLALREVRAIPQFDLRDAGRGEDWFEDSALVIR